MLFAYEVKKQKEYRNYADKFTKLMEYCGIGFPNITALLCAKNTANRNLLIGDNEHVNHSEIGDWIFSTFLEDDLDLEYELFYSKYIMWCKINNYSPLPSSQFNNYKFVVLLGATSWSDTARTIRG